VDDRDRVRESLVEAGIEAGVHYPEPWYLSPAYADAGHRAGLCPVTEAAAGRILSLPIHPHLTHDQQDRVVTALAEAVRA
jgi:dTDP-4-amino-4,6-dideoxygalactose transaminase